MTITEIADNYERDYGFMALNATLENAQLLGNAIALGDELELVHAELVKRGYTVVATEDEYNTIVALHGLPPALAKV